MVGGARHLGDEHPVVVAAGGPQRSRDAERREEHRRQGRRGGQCGSVAGVLEGDLSRVTTRAAAPTRRAVSTISDHVPGVVWGSDAAVLVKLKLPSMGWASGAVTRLRWRGLSGSGPRWGAPPTRNPQIEPHGAGPRFGARPFAHPQVEPQGGGVNRPLGQCSHVRVPRKRSSLSGCKVPVGPGPIFISAQREQCRMRVVTAIPSVDSGLRALRSRAGRSRRRDPSCGGPRRSRGRPTRST